MKPYIILENVALADICFEAYGKNYDELFEHAALALFEMAVDLTTLLRKEKRIINLTADTPEHLLYDFLSEILYLKDAEQLIFGGAQVTVTQTDGKFVLCAELIGDWINQNTQHLENDIKAITLHMFSIKKKKNNYVATVVVDI